MGSKGSSGSNYYSSGSNPDPWITEERENQQNHPVPCLYCSKTFSNSQALGGHQNAHRRERDETRREYYAVLREKRRRLFVARESASLSAFPHSMGHGFGRPGGATINGPGFSHGGSTGGVQYYGALTAGQRFGAARPRNLMQPSYYRHRYDPVWLQRNWPPYERDLLREWNPVVVGESSSTRAHRRNGNVVEVNSTGTGRLDLTLRL